MTASRGFSLLEVLVAVTIIGIGFSLLFSGMSSSTRALVQVQAGESRVELARMKLDELDLIRKLRPRDRVSGVFEDGTQWRLETSPLIAPVEEGPRRNTAAVVRIDLTLEWMGRREMQKRVIQSYRYIQVDDKPVPPLEEQLSEIR